jgi:hypothetical protein
MPYRRQARAIPAFTHGTNVPFFDPLSAPTGGFLGSVEALGGNRALHGDHLDRANVGSACEELGYDSAARRTATHGAHRELRSVRKRTHMIGRCASPASLASLPKEPSFRGCDAQGGQYCAAARSHAHRPRRSRFQFQNGVLRWRGQPTRRTRQSCARHSRPKGGRDDGT